MKRCVCTFHSQEGLLPATASSLIILAEFSRVFLLSDTSARNNIFSSKRLMLLKILMSYFLVFRFTGDAGAVIRILEETKTGSKDEHDKQVMKGS